MDSERGPGDVSRQSRAVLSIDPRKVDGTRGRWQWPRCVFGASWPTAFTGSSHHLSSALSRMYLDSSGGGRFRRHLFSNQYSITKRKIHSLAHFQDEIMGWSNNTSSRRSAVH